jgi:hypothetical protein
MSLLYCDGFATSLEVASGLPKTMIPVRGYAHSLAIFFRRERGGIASWGKSLSRKP